MHTHLSNKLTFSLKSHTALSMMPLIDSQDFLSILWCWIPLLRGSWMQFIHNTPKICKAILGESTNWPNISQKTIILTTNFRLVIKAPLGIPISEKCCSNFITAAILQIWWNWLFTDRMTLNDFRSQFKTNLLRSKITNLKNSKLESTLSMKKL
jgi:hypothetical protein